MAQEHVQRRLAAILVADVAGYSRLMGENEEGTLEALTGHRRALIEPCIADHQGRVVKTTGDGLLAEFASVVDAVRCAVAVQDGMRERNTDIPDNQRLEFRIGVNLGDVIVQDDDLFGDGVNVAARLEGLADPGGICVSDMVHHGVRAKLDLAFEDLGPQRVKNIGEPVRTFRVRMQSGVGKSSPLQKEAPPLPDKPSIAVLPFENMSGDPEQEYFSDGITEDIITELSKISGLFVIARHSSFTYKGQAVTLKQVGQDLGVRYVLEGSVRKAGNRLRITAQLIDTTTDHHLWAERYDRDMEDIFAVQDEVAQKVAEALEVALTPGESRRLAAVPTSNLDAYDAFLRAGRIAWPPTPTSVRSALAAYEEVIKLDPGFAGGHAGKSLALSMAVLWDYSDDPKRDTAVAIETAKRAIELDPNFARSYSALGLAYSAAGNHEEAVIASRRAVELQPSDADSHSFYSRCLLWAESVDESCTETEAAVRLDPHNASGFHLNMMGRSMFAAGRYEDAMKAYERNSLLGGPTTLRTLALWAAASSLAGDLEKGRQLIAEMRRERPGLSLREIAEVRRPGGGSDEEVDHVLKGLRLAWPSE